MTLKTWWKEESFWQKYAIIFTLLYLFIGLNYFFFGLNITDYESHPNEPYIRFSIDVERYCKFSQFVFEAFTITPLMMLSFFPVYFLVFEPLVIFRALEFSYSENLYMLPIIFYLSIPIMLLISIIKSKRKGKKEKVISFILIGIIVALVGNILIQHILFYRPYYALTYLDREPCNYFSQTEYNFNNISISIEDQKCRFKDDKTFVYFTFGFDTKRDDILTWSIIGVRVNNNIEINRDSYVQVNSGNTLFIKRHKKFRLYLILNESRSNEKLILTDSGINERELREWNWKNSDVRDRNNRNYGHLIE